MISTYDRKKIIIFGAGDIGRQAFDYYGEDCVAFFVDNSLSVAGKVLNRRLILSWTEYLRIASESAKIVSSSLLRYFDLEINKEDEIFFSLFAPALMDCTSAEYVYKSCRLKNIIQDIFMANRKVRFCNDAVMMHVLHYVWVRNHTGVIAFNEKIQTYSSINDIFFVDEKYGGMSNGGVHGGSEGN